MKVIECNIETAVLQPVYDHADLQKVCDYSIIPVIAWKLEDEIVTPVTCMGVVAGIYMVRHLDSETYYVPKTLEEFKIKNKYDSKGEMLPRSVWKNEVIKRFQMMHDAKV